MKHSLLAGTILSTAATYLVLAAFFLVVPVEISLGSGISVCVAPCDLVLGKMTRTFTPGHFARAGSHTGSRVNFEMTRDDLLRVYAIGREVHISYSPEGEIYEMDIGFTDLVTARKWQLPAIPIDAPSIWIITDPAETAHVSVFPEATHALVTMNDHIYEGTVYLYFNVAEAALVFLGEAVEPPNGAPLETIANDRLVTLFPMNEAMNIHSEKTMEFEGEEVLYTQEVAMHGFGTLQLSADESLEAAAFYDDEILRNPYEPDPDINLGWRTHYSIFATDGTLLAFYIAAPPEGDHTPNNGEVYIGSVEYWRVVDSMVTAIEAETPPEVTSWTAYPNPATDVVHFSEPTTVSLYDILGRAVRAGEQVQEIDVSGLSPGLYLVRADTGASKTLVIQ